MLKVAPPGFVVAMVAWILWIPWSLFVYFAALEPNPIVTYALKTTANLAVVFAIADLVLRTRGLIRGLLIAALVGAAVPLMLTLTTLELMVALRGRVSPELIGTVTDWVSTIFAWMLWVALALAGWRARRTAVALIVLAFAVEMVPPARAYLMQALGTDPFTLGYIVCLPLTHLFAILLAGEITARAYEPRHDPRRAARGMTILLVGLSALAVVEVIRSLAIWIDVETGLGIGISQVLAGLVMFIGSWRVAQQQLPSLPRYRVHVVAISALTSALLVVNMHSFTLRYAGWETIRDLPSRWWFAIPTVFALALLVTVLARYARHRPAIKVRTAIGGALFTGCVATWALCHARAGLGPLALAAGYLALVPALIRTGRELATDRVETTADVFA